MGAEFADKYPKVASRLVLEPDKCEDPHVERLLEAFAFLAARVHLKIDDEFPEITEALLSILYPHYIRPIPSMSIVQFHVDPEQGKAPGGIRIPKLTPMFSKPVGGVPASSALATTRCSGPWMSRRRNGRRRTVCSLRSKRRNRPRRSVWNCSACRTWTFPSSRWIRCVSI